VDGALLLLARPPVPYRDEQVIHADDAVLVSISSAAIAYAPAANHSQDIACDGISSMDCVAIPDGGNWPITH
jgi:hypothetical protein